MKRIPGETITTTSEDRVIFDVADFKHTDLCAPCITNNRSSNMPPRIDTKSTGLVAELMGTVIRLPYGQTLRLHHGAEIPAGDDYLPQLARLFGDDLRLMAYGASHTGDLLAVTTYDGRRMCAPCAFAESYTTTARKATR